ncbi:MAG: primase C-terminal domain-containing protein [Candidatus Omnitrophica bacterium]|nr:primase C-terminal domain-containing protein [Candidatus Omnitrophota bacterium]
MRRYQWVDFAAAHQKGFRNHVVPLAEVAALVDQYQHVECYSTYFLFTPELLTYIELHPVDGKPSVSGFDGKIWASYLPVDIDSPVLDQSLSNARKLAEFLFLRRQILAEACPIYFSGAKGFHFTLDTRLLGRVAPSHHLHLVFAHFRKELIFSTPGLEREVFDLSIKDKMRLLRLPNTINQKTGLYKIPLTPEELFSLTRDDILAKAKNPHPLSCTDPTGMISKTHSLEPDKELEKIFHRSHKVIERITRRPFRYFIKPKHGRDPEKFLCPGFLAMWNAHIPAGERNNCAIRLLSEFRRNGLDAEISRDLIGEWNTKHAIGLSERELEHTLKSAYARPYPYHYSCHDQIVQNHCPLGSVHRCDEWVKQHPV